MSTAHRPNFDPAKGRASKSHLSAQTTKLDLPSHTKLKFRQPPTASTCSSTASGRRDLKRELEIAEWESTNRKRAKSGLEPLPLPPTLKATEAEEDEEEKRRKEAIQKAIELDRSETDSSSSSEEEEDSQHGKSASESESEQDSDEEEEQDEQAALLRELEKIKAERLAAKQRSSQLDSTTAQISREEEIARGNPLLNLQNAFQPCSGRQTEQERSGGGIEEAFKVKRRWDDDVIFKNQASAAGNTAGRGGQRGFVNDLTRSEFHKKFMNRYIK